MICIEEELLLAQEEDLLLAQEDLLLVQEEDLLLVQEEDILLVQEEDLLLVQYMKHENKEYFFYKKRSASKFCAVSILNHHKMIGNRSSYDRFRF